MPLEPEETVVVRVHAQLGADLAQADARQTPGWEGIIAIQVSAFKVDLFGNIELLVRFPVS